MFVSIFFILSSFFACSEEDAVFQCTEDDILQECDSNGENCEAVEDCAEQGLMCHAEMGHCMAMEDTGSTEDTSMNME